MSKSTASPAQPEPVTKKHRRKAFPVLVLPNHVMIPGCTMPAPGVVDSRVVRLLETRSSSHQQFVCISQLGESKDGRTLVSGYGTRVSVAGAVQQVEDTSMAVLLRGLERVKVRRLYRRDGQLWGQVELLDPPHAAEPQRVAASMQALDKILQELVPLNSASHLELSRRILLDQRAHVALYLLVLHLSASPEMMNAAFAQTTLEPLFDFVLKRLAQELELSRLSSQITKKVQSGIDNHIRRSFVREQIARLRKELGRLEGSEDADEDLPLDEVDGLAEFLQHPQLPEALRRQVGKEIDKLANAQAGSPEIALTQNYLQFLVELPWPHLAAPQSEATDPPALGQLVRGGMELLEKGHFGLTKVKERILESLLSQKISGHSGGALLLVGPPGVGKTSLAKSIAASLGRKLCRVALGGVTDESEVRGHRRTYIGSMPGRILESVHQAGTTHAVMLLDEIDKAGAHGGMRNVSNALLELLDPSQHHAFRDHYLGIPFDLSQVFFVATANDLGAIDRALRDRMEVIEIPAYSLGEKVAIGHQFVLPRVLKTFGLVDDWCLSQEQILEIIEGYTREAGVRELSRRITSAAQRFLYERSLETPVHGRMREAPEESVRLLLGEPPFDARLDRMFAARPGVAHGLAYTPVGGSVLVLEADLLPHHLATSPAADATAWRPLLLTGQLGEVMKESATLAQSFIYSHASQLGVDLKAIARFQTHVHAPEGAVPKDGPSAGITLLSCLMSLYRGLPLSSDLAMTGEITLRGEVLPVGGIREKVVAAHQLGFRRIILPARNWSSLREVDPSVRTELEFFPVVSMFHVLEICGLCGVADGAPLFGIPYQDQSVADILPLVNSPQRRSGSVRVH